MIQTIQDAHRLGTLPGNDLSGAQEGEGHGIFIVILFGSSDEKEHLIAFFSLMDVPLPGLGFRRGGALALPME